MDIVMTKDEIFEMAIQAGFVDYELDDGTTNAFDKRYEAFARLVAEKAIKEALAQPEQDNTYMYASSLATAIWQKHYMKESPKFALLDTTEGVLTQIDNMTCGLVREKPAQPEQEPVVGCAECGANGNFALYCVTCAEKFVGGYKDISWVGLTQTQVKLLWEGVEEEAIKSGDSLNWVFYTHINEALKEKNTREEE